MASDSLRFIQGKDGSYALSHVLGRGAFGTVHKAIWRELGLPVAVKRVSRSHMSAEDNNQLQTEILLFKKLKHKHIVNYIEAVDDPSSPFLDIVMEYIEGGSLFSVVQSIKATYSSANANTSHVFEEPVVAGYIRQVVLGLTYLHRQGVVHRDIKGANILLTKDGVVKLADFGVAVSKPEHHRPIDVAGSPYWMAPEIISLTGSSTASDIWSVGCTLIELLTGSPPYAEFANITALFKIVSDDCPPLPTNISADCEDFLRRCFNKDMHTRPSADELLLHKWLVSNSPDAASEQHVANGDADNAVHRQQSFDAATSRNSADLSQRSAITPLDMYEEDDDEDFDDLDFGEPTASDTASVDSPFATGDASPLLSRSHYNMSFETEVASVTNAETQTSSSVSNRFGRLNIREDPFKDLIEDPEAERERVRLRKQKELWERVKVQTKMLGTTEAAHIAACESLLEMFKQNPEQKYYLIYDPGLLPIIEVLESRASRSSNVVEAMLRVTLSLLDETDENGGSDIVRSNSQQFTAFGYPRVSNIREDLCLAGFLPVVMRYCGQKEPFVVRLLAAQFFNKMLGLERALHMFIACRGFSVFVDLLEPDITKHGELSEIALDGIDRLLHFENQRHKRDFCRRFASLGLLDRIVEGISEGTEKLRQWKKKRRRDAHAKESVANMEGHVTRLAKLLQTFAARADPMVKSEMITQSVLDPMLKQITLGLAPQSAIQSILCCVRDLSRDPQTHLALQSAHGIEALVKYLRTDDANMDTTVRHFIISSLHNLCIVSPARQEAAAEAGLVPHLERFIRSKDINFASLCIDMYSGLGCAGPVTRKELVKSGGVDFYVDLLVLLSKPGTVRKWQARVLQSVCEFLDDSVQSRHVERRLSTVKNSNRICTALAKMRLMDVEAVLEPYLKIITVSIEVNKTLGENQELISAMVRWLESMYDDDDGGGPRSRLLVLRTLLAHSRIWGAKSGNRGLIEALKVLLTHVVLVKEEAITVREQASLLLSALQRVR